MPPTKKAVEGCLASPAEDFKQRLASKLEHGRGSTWMVSVSERDLEAMHGNSNRLFQFLIEGKKAKSLSFDPETLKAASRRTDLFTEKQCERIGQVYTEAEARLAEKVKKEQAEEEQKQAEEAARKAMTDILMPLNAPVVLVGLTKDLSLNRSMGTYEGKAPFGRHRVRLYKDNRLLSIKEENICRYEDFLARQDQANYQNYDNNNGNEHDLSDEDESSEDASDSDNESQPLEWKNPKPRETTEPAPPLRTKGFSIFRRVITAPSSRLGFLIGRKQSTLRHIEAETGIRSIVIGKQITDGMQEVVLTGEKEAVEMAEKLCLDILKAKDEIGKGSPKRVKEPRGASSAGTNSETVVIPVPQLLVQELIGRKGANLMGITKSSKATRITILDPIENGLRQTKIIGRPHAVKKAVHLIEDFCNTKMPGYKTTYDICEEDDLPETKQEMEDRPLANISIESNAISPKEPLPIFDNELLTPHIQQTNSIDPLLAFLTSQKACLKCTPDAFYAWLRQEDVVSLDELAEAVEDADFVRIQMQANGLKGFKRTAFVKAVHSRKGNGLSAGEGKLSLEIPPELECPISHVLMVCDPVVASDGNVYERAAIEEWFLHSRENGSGIVRSPLTNEILPNLNLTSVSTVRNMAKEFCFIEKAGAGLG